MALLFTNNASGTLANTLNIGVTTAVLNAGEGASFPTPSGGDTFYATLEDSSGNVEIVSCTGRSADTLTIVRAQEGTSDQQFAAGSRVELRVTAAVLNALLQSSTAGTTYAPLTHFNDSGTNAELLDNSNIAAKTSTQGVGVRRTTGQTETKISIQSNSGTEEGAVSTDTSLQLDITNAQLAGLLRLMGTNSSSTEVRLLTADPDGSVRVYNADALKLKTETYGLDTFATNSLAPYNGTYRIVTANGSTELAAIGFVDTTNEFRLESYADGFPVGIYANNDGGTLVAVITGDPDGAANLFYANAKKLLTTSTGVTVNGTVIGSTAPTAASHLTRKDYVDTAIAAVTDPAATLANPGVKTWPDGYTEMWGQTNSSSANISVSFPSTFTSVWNVQLTERIAAAGNLEHRHAVTNLTATGFTIDKETDYSMAYYWVAKGEI